MRGQVQMEVTMAAKRTVRGLILAGLCVCACVVVPSAPAAALPAGPAVAGAGMAGMDERAIRKVLGLQTQAWNQGDLEGYMQGYWKSPDLTFYSGGTITGGWEATLERYRKRYQSEGKEMGRLDFPEETVEMLGPDAAVAYGRWRLALSGGKEMKGLYTVILKRLEEGWRIAHDHSSSE
jgi:beta-aspartyl-peptidase (threonine type)